MFDSVKEILAKASEEKSGDVLANIAAKNQEERIQARRALAELTIEVLTQNPVVPYEEDEVTRIIYDHLDRTVYEEIKSWKISYLREYILDGKNEGKELLRIGNALTGEVVAAVAKLMSNMDLIYAASKIEVSKKCRTEVGKSGTLSSRLQPNHPADAKEGILASLYEGLSYGSGDAVIGLNPVNDTPENLKDVMNLLWEERERLEIPTQTCVLGHITTQMEAMKRGGKEDLLFQSIAGSEKGNREFGITNELLYQGQEFILKKNGISDPEISVMYFETGQGSELSSNSHFDADQMTMEARCYGLAKQFRTFLVNSVVGFIGPEYLYNSKQVIRAGLEDHFMAKLFGIPMGVDVCYTNHMKADSNDMDTLSNLLVNAGCNYFIGIPGGDDCMLYYQSLSYHDIAALRRITKKEAAQEFQMWLEKRNLFSGVIPLESCGNPLIFVKGEETKRTWEFLNSKTPARNGIEHSGTRYKTETFLTLQKDHGAAIDSVNREIKAEWLKKSGLESFCTCAADRETYLLRPDLGRLLSDEVKEKILKHCETDPDIQIYISDGLSPDAVESNALETYESICTGLKVYGYQTGTCFFLKNGRVGASDQIGALLRAKVTCVLIGERPGMSTSKSMSAYITYNAYPGIAESSRTVVSNIHEEGINPLEAGAGIAELIVRILKQKISGVGLEIYTDI